MSDNWEKHNHGEACNFRAFKYGIAFQVCTGCSGPFFRRKREEAIRASQKKRTAFTNLQERAQCLENTQK
jgi:hypothetical protein